jgi:predicted DNA-binding ribbon-helix-helix protein
MKSPIQKRSIVVADRKSSVTLENEFWASLKEIAEYREIAVNNLITEIDKARTQPNLSSALRLFILAYYQNASPRTGARNRSPHLSLWKK